MAAIVIKQPLTERIARVRAQREEEHRRQREQQARAGELVCVICGKTDCLSPEYRKENT